MIKRNGTNGMRRGRVNGIKDRIPHVQGRRAAVVDKGWMLGIGPASNTKPKGIKEVRTMLERRIMRQEGL